MKKNIEKISKKVLECIKEKSKTKELANAILKMIDKKHSDVTEKNLLGFRDYWGAEDCSLPAHYRMCFDDIYNCPEDKDNFTCSYIFVCGVNFNCEVGKSFQCANGDSGDYDFNCGQYSCIDSYQCTAGHIFSCSHAHDCNDFSCAAGGQDCSPDHPYEHEPGPMGGSGQNAGDYGCGGLITGNFSCITAFGCTADSDFDCSGHLSFFSCEKQFECGVLGDFFCEHLFSCSTVTGATYDGCPEQTNYSCQNLVQCDGAVVTHACPSGTTNFNCVQGQGYNPPAE